LKKILKEEFFWQFVGTLINYVGHLLMSRVYAHIRNKKKIYKIQSYINLKMTF